MLHTLRIRQLVIIDDLTVEFGPGLNLLTGETGAGKSILVDALGLVAGARGERGLVRSGADRAVVEALFSAERGSTVSRWAESRGIDADESGEWSVRRELLAKGGGRVFVNGSPTTLAVLRELSEQLLEMHGQHEQQSLISPERHLDLLDRFAGLHEVSGAVRQAVEELREARSLRDELAARLEDRERRLAVIGDDLREIDGVAPRPGESAELARERTLLQNGERMGGLLGEAVALTYDGEPSASSLAAIAARKALELASLDPELEPLARRIESAALELQDAGSVLRDYREAADFDPARLESVEARRVALDRLFLRFGRNEEEVLGRREELSAERESLAGTTERLERADAEVRAAESKYAALAAELSAGRRAATTRLAVEVEAQLGALALGRARFGVELPAARGETVEDADGRPLPLHPRGAERAEFRLAANPGEPFRPLARVASGGELSRVMLALHAVVDRSHSLRSVVFDEVDAGVGGAVADAVGSRLAGLGRLRQVLCVTHLPQVAAYADRHFVVWKEVSRQRTRAEVRGLKRDERVEELARMLAGKKATPASRRHASELLGSAGKPRSGRRLDVSSQTRRSS